MRAREGGVGREEKKEKEEGKEKKVFPEKKKRVPSYDKSIQGHSSKKEGEKERERVREE